jgi:hypothetical protein
MHRNKIFYLIAAATATLIIAWLIIRWQNPKDSQLSHEKSTQTESSTPNPESEILPSTAGQQAENETGQTNPAKPLPPDHSRLYIRFLDVSTGYAVNPDAVDIQKRGGQAEIFRSSAKDTDPYGALEVTVPNATYDITVRKTDYLPMSTYFELYNNDLKINFNLEPLVPQKELSSKYIESLHRSDALVVVGYIVDDNSAKPLTGVKIFQEDKSTQTSSDKNGFFQFHVALPRKSDSISKRNSLVFQKNGYSTEIRRNFDMWPNGDMILQIRMKKGGGTHEEKILLNRNASITPYDNVLDKK